MKRVFPLLALLILLSAFANANEFVFYKDEFVLGETVQAESSYEDLDLSKLSLVDSEAEEVAAAFFSKKTDSMNYIYFNLPTNLEAGNLTLQYEETALVDDEVQEIKFFQQFNVVGTNHSFSINPGFIILDNDKSSFKVNLKHMIGDSFVVNVGNGSSALNPIRNSVSLNTGETKSLYVDYLFDELQERTELSLEHEDLGYSLVLLKEEEVVEEEAPVEEENTTEEIEKDFTGALELSNNEIKGKLIENETLEGPIIITNNHDMALHNIDFIISDKLKDIVSLNASSISMLQAGKVFEQYLWVNKNKDAPAGHYQGTIELVSEEGATEQVSLDITIQASEAEPIVVEEEKGLNISDYKPNVSINFSDIKEKEDKSGNLGLAIAIIIVVLILIGILAYRLRPKKGFKKLNSYVTELKKGKK